MRGNLLIVGSVGGVCISIHASTWEATVMDANGNFRDIFQFTPLHERQREVTESAASAKAISIHASTWEATYRTTLSGCTCPISIHASTWEATIATGIGDNVQWFQFTPLHERQQSQLELATMYNDFNSRLYMRGNTVYPVHGRHYNPDFNSRLYMRGNSSCVCSKVYEESISIHASTWEATKTVPPTWTRPDRFQFTPLHERQPAVYAKFCLCIDYFNSRLYMRGNSVAADKGTEATNFNSRLYMRGNMIPQIMWQRQTNFNSRLYMRGNLTELEKLEEESISIHASTWEATRKPLRQSIHLLISIHASTWEATLLQVVATQSHPQFQFTPLHERQHFQLVATADLLNFNSRLYMRGNLRHYLSVQIRQRFQFTPLHERQLDDADFSPIDGNFNSRLYMRGNPAQFAIASALTYFNSRLYMRGSKEQGMKQQEFFDFNSRLYMRGSGISDLSFDAFLYFNSRLYMRGSVVFNTEWNRRTYFNSRLYMRGSSFGYSICPGNVSISIHASTWEAAFYRSSSHWSENFNSRLYMRGSQTRRRVVLSGIYFNSRLYMRGSQVRQS